MPLLFLFILIPIIEIAVLIKVGGELGFVTTLFLVLITAIIGVSLLKQQGLRSWSSIQTSLAQGKLPALEMASGAQLLFAGGLLLTPGFVTDAIGFTLMVPLVRDFVAGHLIKRWMITSHSSSNGTPSFNHDDSANNPFSGQQPQNQSQNTGRVIDGEYEDKTQ